MRTLINLILIFCFLNSYGQDERFIEILVTDNIQLEGKEFIYTILLDDYGQEKEGLQILKEKFIESPDESINSKDFDELVNSEKLKVIKTEGEQFMINTEEFDSRIINIRFDSKMSMSNFVTKLKNYKNINGFISHIVVGDYSTEEQVLLQKLITRGKDKAKKIAQSINKEIGEILEISEIVSNHDQLGNTYNLNTAIGWSSFSPFRELNSLTGNEMKTKTTITKSLRIKYQLK